MYCIFVFLSLFSCNITGQINGHREVNIFAIRYTIFFLFELTLHTFNLSVLLLNISFRWRVAVWLQGGGCYRTIVDTRSLYQKSVAQCEYKIIINIFKRYKNVYFSFWIDESKFLYIYIRLKICEVLNMVLVWFSKRQIVRKKGFQYEIILQLCECI